ncbi:Rdi1p [Rhodotorula paludigena]|uniref:Rdi1p n=1 Tax=Rhodotorula paludigena TaxID=86838 RepID=UPI003174E994
MSQEASSVPDADLNPTDTAGYKVGQQKTVEELAQLDAEDESLVRWKASLGVGAGAKPSAGSGPAVTVLSLSLSSPSRPTPIELDLTTPAALSALKSDPVLIKEGAEYSVELRFRVNHGLVSGLKYIQVVRRLGKNWDKLEAMCGSYGAKDEPYVKKFPAEEAPTGMIARSGTYTVRSRVTDDDKTVHADFEWYFKLGKEW